MKATIKKLDTNNLKILLSFLISLISISTLEAASYYVDATNGNDNHSGISESTAWKSINKVESTTFYPGDIIAFKRGEIWYDNLTMKSSGKIDNPIRITAYGTGNKPIISGLKKLSGTWINEGGNTWSISNSSLVSRLFKDNVELKRASKRNFGHFDEEFGDPATGTVWIWENGKILYYSATNPQKLNIEGTLISSTISINGLSNITIDGIETEGAPIRITNGENIHIFNCSIGKKASGGFVLKSSNNITIENNIIDADFKLKYTGLQSYTGTDYRGVNDGIAVYAGLTNSTIKNNTFKNWGHAAIGMTSNIPIENNKIYNNIFTAPDIIYGRGMGYSGNGIQNNEIHHNLFYKLQTQNQLNGKNNHFHHNWFDNMNDTPLKNGEQGQAITLAAYNGNPTGNIFEYNTITNTEGPGIELIASGNSSKDISGNIFRKNLFENCGTTPYYSYNKGVGIAIQRYDDIGSNTFTDNAFKGIESYINHRHNTVTTSVFNERNGIEGDIIHGNTYTITDQGAGELNISSLGANHVNSEIVVSSSTNVQSTTNLTPFVMTRGLIE